MSCHHTEATLLWMYGEGDEAHATHVATCAECQAVVQEHEQVASALGPTLGALATPAPPRVPVAANTPGPRRWFVGVSGMALVAVAVVAVWIGTGPRLPLSATGPTPEPVALGGVDTALAQATLGVPSDDRLDVQLDTLELELDALSLDLEML
jgi:hypothetical protein